MATEINQKNIWNEIVIICCFLLKATLQDKYGMDEDYCMNNQVMSITGATVLSQNVAKYYTPGVSCTMTFKGIHDKLLVQITDMDIFGGSGESLNCSVDHLTISSNLANGSSLINLDGVCGRLNNLRSKVFSSLERSITIQWITSSSAIRSRSHIGFKIILTSFEITAGGVCRDSLLLCPQDGICVDKSLQCDHVAHCSDRTDEAHCEGPTTQTPATTTNTSDVSESETFWFISMLGIIVVSILGAIIAIIRRRYTESHDLNRAGLSQDNLTHSYETYGRQTSVLSTGSATGNTEPPPEYDEALHCSVEPLPPSYSEVDFESTTTVSFNLADSSQDSSVTPSNGVQTDSISNSVTNSIPENNSAGIMRSGSSRRSHNNVRIYIPSEDDIPEDTTVVQRS